MGLRAAICVSGHARHYHAAAERLRTNVIAASPDFAFDVFVSTYWNTNWRQNGVGDSVSLNQVDFLNAFSPIRHEILDPQPIDTSPLIKAASQIYVHHGTRGEHVVGMYRGIRNVMSLRRDYEREQNIRYDVVMRFRPDFCINTPLNLSDYLKELPNSVFVTAHGCGLPNQDIEITAANISSIPLSGERLEVGFVGIPGVTDWFAFGPSEMMDHYGDLSDQLLGLVQRYGIFAPEAVLFQHLRLTRRDISVKTIPSNVMNWHIDRPPEYPG